MAAFTRDQCGKRVSGTGNSTMTRTLRDDCFTWFQGHAAGLIAGGGVGGAISTAGWLKRIRDAERRS